MTHSATPSLDSKTATQVMSDRQYAPGYVALLALRTQYGLQTIEVVAMDRITSLRVAATLEFLSNNLPKAP